MRSPADFLTAGLFLVQCLVNLCRKGFFRSPLLSELIRIEQSLSLKICSQKELHAQFPKLKFTDDDFDCKRVRTYTITPQALALTRLQGLAVA